MARTDKPTQTQSPKWAAKHVRPRGKQKFQRTVRQKTKLTLKRGDECP